MTKDKEIDIRQSLVNDHDTYDPRRIIKRTKGKYLFKCACDFTYFFLYGYEVDLDPKMTPAQCRKIFLNVLSGRVDINNKMLLLYFQGGIPFINGTLGDIIDVKEIRTNNRIIYGVLTGTIPESDLTLPCHEICDISTEKRKLLLSPFYDSTDRGLCDMACLMGYINHGGFHSEHFLKVCALIINFPPLMTSMQRIMNRDHVVYRDVITVCSTLFAFFCTILPPRDYRASHALESCLQVCNLMSKIDKDLIINVKNILYNKEDKTPKWIPKLELDQSVYIYDEISPEEMVIFDYLSDEDIEHAFDSYTAFKPILPMEMRDICTCSIVKGKDHEYLYIMPSQMKDSASIGKVDIIDPMTGKSRSYDIEKFAKEQKEETIDANKIDQIVMFVLDDSDSMHSKFDGFEKTTVINQYLTSYMSHLEGYKVSSIQGLLSFNNVNVTKIPFTTIKSDILDIKKQKITKGKSVPGIWDSISKSCNEIVDFRKDNEGNELYNNSLSKIVVFTDGIDNHSFSKVYDVAKELVANDVSVDIIVLNPNIECKIFYVVSYMTDGAAFRLSDIKEGLDLFDKEEFVNIKYRMRNNSPVIEGDRRTIPTRLKRNCLDLINEDFINNAIDHFVLSNNLRNRECIHASTKARLGTPLHHLYRNRDTFLPTRKIRRVMREIHYAAEVEDPSSQLYDPDIKTFIFQACFDRWRVFLKGPVGTPYEKKWWHLYVIFPENYPYQPPNFRFVTVPFHLNISQEGRICSNYIEKGYLPSNHVIQIIQEIREILIIPNPILPLNIKACSLFYSDIYEYERMARDSQYNAKDDYSNYLEKDSVIDEVGKDYILYHSNDVPLYKRSQIYGEPLNENKMILSSSGIYYDKEELKQLFASNDNPICVATGEHLIKVEDGV